MRFSKWHALGNAYLLVERADVPGGTMTPEYAARLCDVETGIGSDGIVEITALDGAAADAVIWNPDGSEAEFSGNGARIAAAWLAARAERPDVVLRFGEREVTAHIRAANVELAAGPVEVGPTETLDADGEELEVTPVGVGNPHAVIRRDAPARDLARLGPQVETHPRFPRRTNVQLVRVTGPNELEVAVWERGAGLTSSSGSSAVAAAAAAIANGWCESPVTVVMPGGALTVAVDADSNATLTGPVEEICRGEALAR
jgi:diaminopimelate epimerase